MTQNQFSDFDPLESRLTASNVAATNAMRREITNILGSYVGWYDPFAESIQNALDSVEAQASKVSTDYTPSIWIAIDLEKNSLTVTDNGTGLDARQFQSFLAPDFSFKSGNTRGEKGVGATYLAYGFNYIQIATRTPDFEAVGKMVGARTWTLDTNPAGNPRVTSDPGGPYDRRFSTLSSGVSIHLQIEKNESG